MSDNEGGSMSREEMYGMNTRVNEEGMRGGE